MGETGAIRADQESAAAPGTDIGPGCCRSSGAASLRPGIPGLKNGVPEDRAPGEPALARAILDGIDGDEFRVLLQPIVEARSHVRWGAEALARWPRPGMPGPDVFIAAAERSGAIHRLALQLMEKALVAARPLGGVLSCNISPLQLADPAIVARVAALLDRTGFPAGQLELEVTEGQPFADDRAAVTALEAFRAMGIRISLDDFGVGYASLATLARLPLDKLKLDRAYVTPLDAADPALAGRARAVLEAVVGLARAYDLKVTAEGVETEAQAAILRDAGVDLLQGFLFGRPEAAGGR